MQPCGLNECADKRVEHGGTLVRISEGGVPKTRAPPLLYCYLQYLKFSVKLCQLCHQLLLHCTQETGPTSLKYLLDKYVICKDTCT